MVQVRVSEGLLEGEVVQNEYGGSYCSFKGIPFAQPPIGDLRFKPPQPVKPWQGVRKATEFGPICYQFNITNTKLSNMSEDCLYLNVYTPDIKPSKPLPVMVWIHGGGYFWGSGNDDLYGPEFLVRNDVILVTINYRLEVLGFLCLDSEDVPGNAGMKDQVAALRWVKENIASFGGNPENITIFGESAGAGSVSYHLVSPMAKGLFNRVISQSGGLMCFWTRALEPREKALLLAKRLGCQSEDDKELYEFFKNQPVEKLVDLNLQITLAQKPYEIHFSIVDEKDFGKERFFYGDIPEAIRNNVQEGVDIMTGYTQDEGLMAIHLSGSLENMIPKAKVFTEFFTPKVIQRYCSIEDQFKAARKIKKFYYKDNDISMENYEQYKKFLNLEMFAHGVLLSAKLQSIRNKLYFYKFSCTSERNGFADVFKVRQYTNNKPVACHCDDLPYIFPVKLFVKKVDKYSDTFKLIERVTRLWTNFAKYGNPTPDDSFGIKWKPYSIEAEDYMDIGNQLVACKSPDKEEQDLWESVYQECYPKFSVKF